MLPTSPIGSAAASGSRSTSGATLPCSARGCRSGAAWALRWNNPRLHDPQRRKTWLACPEHRSRLGDFLQLRGFLRETRPVADLVQDDADALT